MTAPPLFSTRCSAPAALPSPLPDPRTPAPAPHGAAGIPPAPREGGGGELSGRPRRAGGATSLFNSGIAPGLTLWLRARLVAVRRVAVLPGWANAAPSGFPAFGARTRRYFCLFFSWREGAGRVALTVMEPVLLFLAGVGGVCASRGSGEGSDAGLIYSALNSGSPGTSLAVACTGTAVPYIILSCSLNVRVEFS